MRSLRQSQGLTQDQLAERARVDPRVIRFVESGERDVGVSTVWMLAKGLNVAPEELFKV